MDVSISELRIRLSELLNRAEAGETIRVTKRGRPKALLGPLPGQDVIERGIAEGWLTPPKRGHRGPVRPLRLKGRMSVAELLAEDRGE